MSHAALAHLDHFVRSFALRLVAVFAIYLVGLLIEERRKIDDAPNRKGLLLNCAHVLVFHGAELSLGVMTAYYLHRIVDKIPLYKAPIHFHGGAFEIFALTCFALATHDFLYYWLHRLQHTSKWLWAEHELHHSDEHVNVTTSGLHHWLETVLQPLFILPPVFLLFDPPVGTVIWVILFSKFMVFFVHLNSPIRFGWFNRVLSSPQSHRIHHSNLPEHMNKNFATILPLWDIVFGTYYHPKEQEWPSTGVTGVSVTSLRQAIVLPFVSWSKMLREIWLVRSQRPSPSLSDSLPSRPRVRAGPRSATSTQCATTLCVLRLRTSRHMLEPFCRVTRPCFGTKCRNQRVISIDENRQTARRYCGAAGVLTAPVEAPWPDA